MKKILKDTGSIVLTLVKALLLGAITTYVVIALGQALQIVTKDNNPWFLIPCFIVVGSIVYGLYQQLPEKE